jgi:hypothetical protein
MTILDPNLERAVVGIDASRRLGRILRLLGGAFLIASASTFLFHRWEQGSDLMRYAMLLLHTVFLAAAALFCGFGVKESRGARTFLAITLAIVPINAAVLGGLVYSQFAQDADQAMRGGSFLWVAPSPLLALLSVAATLAVLTPAIWVAYRTLARRQASKLFVAFMLVNTLLVVPWRLPLVTTLLAVLGTLAVTQADTRWFSRDPAATTVEGRIARVTLVLPLALVLGRGMHLYPSFLLDAGALSLAAGIVLAALGRSAEGNRQHVLGSVALLALAGGWCGWWLHWWASAGAIALPSLFLPLAALFLTSARSSAALRPLCRTGAAICGLLAVVPNLWVHPSIWTLFACASVGALVLCAGAWLRSKILTIGGLVAVVTAIAYQIGGNLDLERLKHWAVLSVLGVLLIVFASYWERYQATILCRLRRWHDLAREWDY